ncbi:CAMK family protein kinase [Tritrichomonas foetus]|uniref:CAMK family protein kinase n=1 Tax=Tritrichomonas foetus TaxID=1144522 RepID=A0A1J4K7N0_9EUKA|nr:CAMK family protein kinase [Tritrichomonas foetus]|eukprot:OHT07010.1 CAMK family protein kinase [Tritrichomonas foetus]
MEKGLKEELKSRGFEYIGPVGSGGFGSVHLVQSIKYKEQFCVKIIPLHRESQNAINRITAQSEVEVLCMLDHPYIIQIYESFTDKENLYIILEHCPGGSLKEYISNNGPLYGKELYNFSHQIVSAIEFCHEKRIAHRDIKPSNCLLDKYGRVKLADFGLSSYNEFNNSFDNIGGSPFYMSPESFKKGTADAFKSDMWALGVTLYYLGVGQLPFYCRNLTDLKNKIKIGLEHYPPNVESSFAKIVLGLLTPNLEKRWTISDITSSEFFTKYANETSSPLTPLVRRATDCRMTSGAKPNYVHSGVKLRATLTQTGQMNSQPNNIGFHRTPSAIAFLVSGPISSTQVQARTNKIRKTSKSPILKLVSTFED